MYRSKRALLLLGAIWLGASGAALWPEVGAAAQPSPPEPQGEGYVGVQACLECHEDQYYSVMASKQGQAADPRTPFAHNGCESCHGPGERHALSEGGKDFGDMIRFGKHATAPAEQQDAACIRCHEGGRLQHWHGSTHDQEGTRCVDCHTVHRRDAAMSKATEVEVCDQCHWKIRAETHKAFVHPVRQGQMVCSDCHNPHGSAGPAELNWLSLNESCYECHAELRGPFLWEHYPVSEDCSICHTVHGSNNPGLLVKRVPQLCEECHQSTDHTRRIVGFEFTPPEPGGTNVGPTRFFLGEGCLNCHGQIHGSNHPSGFELLR